MSIAGSSPASSSTPAAWRRPGSAGSRSGAASGSGANSGGLSAWEEVLAAVELLQEDTRHEAALGDAAGQNRNIVVSDAALTLRDLVRSKPENMKLAMEAGGIEALVQALANRPNSEAVQKGATSTLGYLVAHSPEARTTAGAKGGVEAVISALRGHPNSVAVQEHAIEALGKLMTCSHRENQDLARKAAGIEACVLALEQHRGSEALQRHASVALSCLVEENYEAQLQTARVGGIDAVIAALKAHPNSEAVQEHAAVAIVRLVEHNYENQARASELGAITVVTDALKWHRKSTVVQVAALRALRELVVDNTDNQTLAGNAGVMGTVMSVLKFHIASEVVQQHVCEALSHLVANNQASQKLAREAGAVEAVVQVVARHLGSAAVQAKASHALGHLVANNVENQRTAGEAKGIDVLVQGLRRHLDEKAVNEHAAEALGFLAARNRENQVLARNAGAIEEVIRMLRQFPNYAAVQAKASSALRKLVVGNHDNTNVAVETGGIEEVIRVLKQQPISEMEDPRKFQKRAREAGLIEAVVAKLRQTGHKEGHKDGGKASKAKSVLQAVVMPSQATLLSALCEIVSSNFENQTLAAEAGGVQVAVAAMSSEPGSDSVQASGARTVAGLAAENAANQRRAKDVGAGKVLLEAQAAFLDNAFVQDAVREALAAVHSGDQFHGRIMTTEYGKRHAHSTPIPDIALRGVTLEQLLELQDFVQDTLQKHDLTDLSPSEGGANGRGKSVVWEKLTMYQLRDHFILPLTRVSKCSFVEVVAHGKQPPLWMVSHWWGTPFPFTVRMLQLQAQSRYMHGASAVTYWCCTFANNQHNLSELDDGDVLKSPFARAMLSPSCMGTVLLCDPEVTPLLRTWCVFEAHLTQQLRCGKLLDRTDKRRYFLDILAPVVHEDSKPEDKDKFIITMLQDAIGGSWNEVSDMEGVFFPLGVAHVGVGVDVCKAETSVEADRAAIMNYLASGKASKAPPPLLHPKYNELNAFVHLVFASAELYRVACEQRDDSLQAASALIELRADVNSFVRQGNTPLFAAAGADTTLSTQSNAMTQRGLVELLLNARADVNHANAEMKTVLDCASALSEDARGLLLEHGAKTFSDAAPELERQANAQLSQILSTGFGSERQAFVGGDAGTKLTGAAQRSLQVVATAVLKLYPWAPCRIGIQTDSGRHQAQLAGERVQSVKATLESAGCKNTFDMHYGSQRALVTISLSLLPPTSPAQRAVKSSLLPASMPLSVSPTRDRDQRDRRSPNNGAGQPPSPDLASPSAPRAAQLQMQRSPQAILALQGNFSRLPPVSHGEFVQSPQVTRPATGALGTVGAALMGGAGAGGRQQAVGTPPSQAAFGEGRYHPAAGSSTGSSSSSGPRRQAWSQAPSAGGGPGTPPGQSPGQGGAGGAGGGRGLQGGGGGGGLAGAAAAFAGFDGGTAHSPQGSTGSRSGVASTAAQRAAHRGSCDLSALAGERWSRTSITCSVSSPALPQMPGAGWPRSTQANGRPPSLAHGAAHAGGAGGAGGDWASLPAAARPRNASVGSIPATNRPTSGRAQATPKAVHGSWLRSDANQPGRPPGSAEGSPSAAPRRSLPALSPGSGGTMHRTPSHQGLAPSPPSHPQVFSVSDLMG